MPEDRPRCAACGGVIGVYEPVVVVRAPAPAGEDGEVRAGSPAPAAPPVRYHMACWTARSRVDERAGERAA